MGIRLDQPAAGAAAGGRRRSIQYRTELHPQFADEYLPARRAGFFVSPGWTLDGWNYQFSAADGDGGYCVQAASTDNDRLQIGDEALTYHLGTDVQGGTGAGAGIYFDQKIETIRRLSGQAVTISFWAATSGTVTHIGVNLYQVFGSGGSPSGYAKVLATGLSFPMRSDSAWQRYSATITIPSSAGKTIGTNGDDATWLRFFYSAGSSFNQEAGFIGAQSGVVNLWGVQLERGTVATPLEKTNAQQDLALCQRYSQVGQFYLGGYAGAGGAVGASTSLLVTMRAPPALVPTFTETVNVTGLQLNTIGSQAVFAYASSVAAGNFILSGTFTASAEIP